MCTPTDYNFNIVFGITSDDIQSVGKVRETMKDSFSEILFSDLLTINNEEQSVCYQLASFDYTDDETELKLIVDRYNRLFPKSNFELISIGTAIISPDILKRPYFKQLIFDLEVELTYFLDYMGYFRDV